MHGAATAVSGAAATVLRGRCGMSDAGSKLMMILWMLLGLLELMPILVMLSPGTWKER